MKELKITPPEGYEVDKEKSTFDCIKFKKIKQTGWEKFCNKVSSVRGEWYINNWSGINTISSTDYIRKKDADKNFCETKEDAEAILAFTQLRRMWHWKRTQENGNSDGTLSKIYLSDIDEWRVVGTNGSGLFPFQWSSTAWNFIGENKDLFDKIKILFQ